MKKLHIIFGMLFFAGSVYGQVMVSGENDVSAALANIESTRVKDRLSAIDVLSKNHNSQSIEAISKLVADKKEEVRLKAVKALGDFKDESSAEALGNALNDNEEDIRLAAVNALSGLKGDKALELLIKATADKENDIRITAIKGLAGFKDKKAVEALSVASKAKDENVRIECVRSLAYIKIPGTEEVIAKFLDDPKIEVKYTAINALILNNSESVIPSVEKLLENKDIKIRLGVVCVLGVIGGNKAETAIIKALNDRAPVIRQTAVKILQGCGSQAAVGVMINLMMSDPDQQVRQASLEALGSLADPDAIAFLNDKIVNFADTPDRSKLITVLADIITQSARVQKEESKMVEQSSAVAVEQMDKESLMRMHYERAAEYFKNGDYEKSIIEWQEVLKIDPNHEQSQRMIERAKEKIKK